MAGCGRGTPVAEAVLDLVRSLCRAHRSEGHAIPEVNASAEVAGISTAIHCKVMLLCKAIFCTSESAQRIFNLATNIYDLFVEYHQVYSFQI